MPTARSVEIDFQQEGDFKSAVSLPKDLQEPLAARFKDMASADVTIQELPQNGRVPILWQGKSLAASAAFIPGEYGERITLQFDFT